MGKSVYRMSSAGKCPKALGAIRLGLQGEPFPKWLETSAEEGKWHELRIKNEINLLGEWTVFDEQSELLLDLPTFILKGHIDGKLSKDGELHRLLEVKSMSSFEFQRWMKGGFEAFPQYASQLACYFAGVKLPECLYVVKNRDSGYIDRHIYLASDFTSELEAVVGKIALVEGLALENKLADVEFNPDNLECKRCAYKKLCVPEPKALTAVTQKMLQDTIDKVREGKRIESEGKAIYDEGKSVLKDYTYSTNQRKWSYNNMAVTLIKVRDTVTYPKEAIEAKVPEDILKEIAVAKPGYEFIKIEDLEKE